MRLLVNNLCLNLEQFCTLIVLICTCEDSGCDHCHSFLPKAEWNRFISVSEILGNERVGMCFIHRLSTLTFKVFVADGCMLVKYSSNWVNYDNLLVHRAVY